MKPGPQLPTQMDALVSKANAAARQGRLADAEKILVTIVERKPGHFDSLHGLGLIHYRRGDLSAAEQWIKRAIEVDRTSAPAHNNLGSVYFAAGRLDPAISQYRTALSLAPAFVDARNNLGAALAQRGDLAEAREQYEAVLRTRPNHAGACNNLGALLQRLGLDGASYFARAVELDPCFLDALTNLARSCLSRRDFEQAVELFGKALCLQPDSADARYGMGIALARRGEFERAIYHYRTAIASRTDFPEAEYGLGSALDAVGDAEGAIASFRRAVGLAPKYADAHAALGVILARLGNLAESRRELELAVKLAPGNARFLISLADWKRFEPGDPHIGGLESLLTAVPALNDDFRAEVHFALAKAYDDISRFDRAAPHMMQANALRRQQIVYDETSALEELKRTRNAFTVETFQHARAGHSSNVPIFIVGMPRSGTTLIEQVLASHANVFGAGELRLLGNEVAELPGRMGSRLAYPDFLPAMDEAWLARLAQNYLSAIAALAPDALRIVDKMPANFRFVGLIHLAFPNARIIHARRDPLDTCLSCYSIRFSEGQAFAYDLRELGRLYKGYDRLMRHWHEVLPPGVMIDVCYEQLIADFESETRRIAAHCNLEWSEACLNFHQTKRPVHTASAAQVRRPLYDTSVGRWRSYAEMLQPLRQELDLND